MDDPDSPAAARIRILDRIARSARAAGRDPASIRLTAACKGQPRERVARLIAAGHLVFGENRVQEAAARWKDVDARRELRLIGPLQTNKAALAAEFFDVIETLDRPRLARALAEQSLRLGRAVRVFVQVNTGEEFQKAGISPREADGFIAACRDEYDIWPEGLMCVPPAAEPPALHFALLARIARGNGIAELSMGMSADFEIAVRFGATLVRVGSALFGARATGH